MAYIEAHQSLRDHRKILALAAELDMPEPHVAGHCLYLWLWAIDNAPEGTLPASERIIERAAGWTGTPGAFVAAMVNCGMLDRDEGGALHLHDWYDYAGRLIEKRRENAERMRNARASKTEPKYEPRATHVQRTSDARAGATVEYRTVTASPMHEESVVTSFAAAVADGTAALRVAPVDSVSEPKPAGTILTLPVQASAPVVEPAPERKRPSPQLRRAPLPAAATAPDEAAPAADRKPVNPLWDALVAAFGFEPQTNPERSKWGKVVKDLKAVQATPEQVHERCRNHAALTQVGTLHWTLTPTALAAHWGELGQPPRASPTASRAVSSRPQPPAPVLVPAASKDIWARSSP